MNKIKEKDKKDQIILLDVYIVYSVCILIGFIGTLVYYCLSKYFSYLVGWIFPTPFVLGGLFLQQIVPDILLRKARDYGERAEKPKGFMLVSVIFHISSYVLYVLPFIIMGIVSSAKDVSLTDKEGWFNIYCALGSTFLILILVFVVKLIKNYYSNKRNKTL